MSPRAVGGAFFSEAGAGAAGALGTKVGGRRGAMLAEERLWGGPGCGPGEPGAGSLPRLTEGAAVPALEVGRLGEEAA